MPEPITDDIVDIARPLIRRATREGFREGMIEGKHLFLTQLGHAIDHAEDLEGVRRWYEANRLLLQEYRL